MSLEVPYRGVAIKFQIFLEDYFNLGFFFDDDSKVTEGLLKDASGCDGGLILNLSSYSSNQAQLSESEAGPACGGLEEPYYSIFVFDV